MRMGFSLPSRPRLLSLNRPPPSHRSPKKRRGTVTQPLFCLGCLARQRPSFPRPSLWKWMVRGRSPRLSLSVSLVRQKKGRVKIGRRKAAPCLYPTPDLCVSFLFLCPVQCPPFLFPSPLYRPFLFPLFLWRLTFDPSV